MSKPTSDNVNKIKLQLKVANLRAACELIAKGASANAEAIEVLQQEIKKHENRLEELERAVRGAAVFIGGAVLPQRPANGYMPAGW